VATGRERDVKGKPVRNPVSHSVFLPEAEVCFARVPSLGSKSNWEGEYGEEYLVHPTYPPDSMEIVRDCLFAHERIPS